MTVFEIVVCHNDDNWIQLMYLVDQSKLCAQIYLQTTYMLHKFAITNTVLIMV